MNKLWIIGLIILLITTQTYAYAPTFTTTYTLGAKQLTQTAYDGFEAGTDANWTYVSYGGTYPSHSIVTSPVIIETKASALKRSQLGAPTGFDYTQKEISGWMRTTDIAPGAGAVVGISILGTGAGCGGQMFILGWADSGSYLDGNQILIDCVPVTMTSDYGTKTKANEWYFFDIKYNYSTGDYNINLYDVNLNRLFYKTGTAGAHATTNITLVQGYDADITGYFDNIGYQATVTTLPLTASFTYTINKTASKINLKDTSTVNGLTITNWEWKSNGSVISTTQDYNYSATELTDYNICLKVTGSDASTSTSCQNISTGDWTAPVTTFTSNQVVGTTDQNITLTCTDNNSGCKAINYKIDSDTWINIPNTVYGITNLGATGTSDSEQYGTSKQAQSFTLATATRIAGATIYVKTKTGSPQDLNISIQTNNAGKPTGTLAFPNAYKVVTAAQLTAGQDNNIFFTSDYNLPAGTYHIVVDNVAGGGDASNKYVLYYKTSGNGRTYWDGANWVTNDPNQARYGYITGTGAATGGIYNFLYHGGGVHSIQYFSTDNSDNNETTKNGTFNTYGNVRFNVYDENTNTSLNNVNINFNEIDYNASPYADLNLQGITAGTYTATLTKTGYCDRYYQLDANVFSDQNISFLMLPSTACNTNQFQFFAPDQSTQLANAYVTVTNFSKSSRVAERLKTDATGNATFDLNMASSSYGFHIDYGSGYDYNAISVLVKNPQDEATSVNINATWNLEVSGVAIISDYNITALTNQALMVYANTYNNYILRISSNSASPVYFTRNYAVKLLGYPAGYTLQPYLISSSSGYQMQIQSLNAYTYLPIPNIDVKIYKLLPQSGLTLIEEEVTDGSGYATTSLLVNQNYVFNAYQNGVLRQSQTITGQSAAGKTLYIYITNIGTSTGDLNTSFVSTSFDPVNTIRKTTLFLDQIVNETDFNSGLTITNVTVTVENNGSTVYTDSVVPGTYPYTHIITYDYATSKVGGAVYDSNYVLKVCVLITTNKGNQTTCQTYNQPGVFNIQDMLGATIRPLFGCSGTALPDGTYPPCPTLLLAALFISICISVLLSVGMGYTNVTSIGLFFMFLMGIFTYFTWVPAVLFIIMLVGVIFLIVAEGGRRL